MYVIVDERDTVAQAYTAAFSREGISCVSFSYAEFADWLGSSSDTDLSAVDAFLLGDSESGGRNTFPRAVHARCRAPVIALNSRRSLGHTLELFEAGVDDVVAVPVHARELLVRAAAIRGRTAGRTARTAGSTIRVFFDGRDPEVGGEPLPLPRRELRILEYMVSRQGKWVTKTQIFNAIYGIFDSGFEESVIESHISKLRKKVRGRLGYDPILSRRYLGYRLDDATPAIAGAKPRSLESYAPTRATSQGRMGPAIFSSENPPAGVPAG